MKEVAERRKREEAERRERMGSTTASSNDSNNGYGGPPTGPRAQRQPPSGPAAMRGNNQNGNMPPPPPPTNPRDQKSEKTGEKRPLSAPDQAVAAIRARYMGQETGGSTFKKKRRKTAERKFTFEWGAEEDTSPDYNPLYNNRAEAQFFGRGRLGGFAEDDKQTKKYVEALRARGDEEKVRAQEILEMDRRRKEEKGWIEKHWSEKPLEMMKERDWRIFKEDFNISTKGEQTFSDSPRFIANNYQVVQSPIQCDHGRNQTFPRNSSKSLRKLAIPSHLRFREPLYPLAYNPETLSVWLSQVLVKRHRSSYHCSSTFPNSLRSMR